MLKATKLKAVYGYVDGAFRDIYSTEYFTIITVINNISVDSNYSLYSLDPVSMTALYGYTSSTACYIADISSGSLVLNKIDPGRAIYSIYNGTFCRAGSGFLFGTGFYFGYWTGTTASYFKWGGNTGVNPSYELGLDVGSSYVSAGTLVFNSSCYVYKYKLGSTSLTCNTIISLGANYTAYDKTMKDNRTLIICPGNNYAYIVDQNSDTYVSIPFSETFTSVSILVTYNGSYYFIADSVLYALSPDAKTITSLFELSDMPTDIDTNSYPYIIDDKIYFIGNTMYIDLINNEQKSYSYPTDQYKSTTYNMYPTSIDDIFMNGAAYGTVAEVSDVYITKSS